MPPHWVGFLHRFGQWKRVLPILVWNQVSFLRELRECMTLSFQFQMSEKEREICEFEMDLKNFICLRSNLSNNNRSEMGTDFRGLVWKRMGNIREPGGTPPPRIPRSTLPPPPGVKATRTLTSRTSWKATGSLMPRLIERFCLTHWRWMPLF